MAVVTRFITKNAECVLKDEACVKLQMNGVGNNILILHWLNYLLLFFSDSDVHDVSRAYFVQDGLLLRKWSPHGEDFVGDTIVQVVVPTKFHSII